MTSDDILFRSPHEHSDSAAVLAALDSVAVCYGSLGRPRAFVFAALLDSSLVKLAVAWRDSLGAPSYDSLYAQVAARLGPADDAPPTSATWERDSLAVEITRDRWWFSGRPQIYVSHARGCVRYELLVHAKEPSRQWAAARTQNCWVAAPLPRRVTR